MLRKHPLAQPRLSRKRRGQTIDSNQNWKTASNWTYVGVVATEDGIRSMDINPRISHFWAPAGFRHNGRDYLFVPNLYNGNDNTGSRVYVFDAPSETGTYAYRGRIDTSSTVNGGYASDPFVLRDYDGSVYMFFANGNDTNCGGVSRTRHSGDNLLSEMINGS
ncbi:MAG: family 43 glycosylhydrolase [Micromonosporaceae bacterium]|nr:family 43 glycosylhydrolase [Micromonosporaceae bacterium]